MILYAEVAFDLPLEEDTFTYEVPEDTQPGVRVLAKLRNRDEEGIVVSVHHNEPAYTVLAVQKVIDKTPIVLREQIDLAYWMKDQYVASLGECIHKMIPAGRRQVKLEAFPSDAEGKPVTLNEEQNVAYQRIVSTLGKTSVHLLFGITGSGKTEVYIHLIRKTLETPGRSAILLVPEISLTFHIIRKLELIFPGQLAVLHSALKVSEKFKAYNELLSGKKRIAVGTRSAVFAPVSNLGLIIIDEDHDSSFKEHSSPRYHARQVAMQRCKTNEAVLVLGTATPSLEIYHLAKEGKIHLHTLTKRPEGVQPPAVRIVENQRESNVLSSELSFAIKQRLDKKEQVILLLNRRGYSPLIYSPSTSSYVPCPNCTTNLCYHKKGTAICHLCGHTETLVSLEKRMGETLTLKGTGTQKLEENLLEAFPQTRVERLDQDSIQDRSLLNEVISRLLAGEIDILTGTQMIAKGLDASQVTLVGVLNAGIGLGLPDFRANERVFSLLTQVAGRAGRSKLKGEVLIETNAPDHPVIQMATTQNYIKFYESEIKIRKDLFYPPFSRLIRIVSRSKEEGLSLETIESVFVVLKKFFPSKDTILLGPAPCPFYRIDSNFRNHIILKTSSLNVWREILKKEVRPLKLSKKVYLEIDFDPLDLV
ncbi:primosomal protein N' [Leptospira gomenensis]|uniref:Replication restart protein PriA n=1 Tax=Leptospira gomenensis TaxID=2484974 RepID=A0A5F1YC87_9LEPT|nr:primosomal protein N' [Leptospira gomenensis]TGK35041.1 primosomal protein N' [Leptospira gomenensis]TGK35281.1 primosomal protein N' [Leptospira gomenensis]TGK51766.1 primosomal protein N' [Leptospira gomenensis]TGK58361.1 primosomal protein N' [Leptospira gomenensis]